MTWINLSDTKAFLRVDHDDDDTLIELLIDAAGSHVEAITGTNFSPTEQTFVFENWLDVARLPGGPVQSIDGIEFTDLSGVQQTLQRSDYTLRVNGLSASIRQPAGVTWPRILTGSLWVHATVGYPDGQLPAPVRQAALLILGDLYNHREDTIAERSVTPVTMPNGVETLLANFRVY